MLEKGRISGSQLIALIAVFVIGTSVILTPARDAKQSAWLAVMAGMIIGLFFNIIYAVLAMRFPGKVPMEYNDIIFGKYLGKLISVSQLWFIFHLGSLVLRNVAEFFNTSIMPETPMIVFAVLMIMVCASAARNGIEVIARCSTFILFITYITFFNDFLWAVKDIKISNYLPLIDMGLRKFLTVSYATASFPFAETVAFLMIFPFINKNKEIPTSTVKGILLAGLFLTLEVIRNIGVLGNSSVIFTYPTFEAVRLIDVAKIVTRMEVIVSNVFILIAFIKCSILLYGTVLGTAHLLKMRMDFNNVTENIEFATKIYPVYSLPFELLIPLISLVVAKVRRLPGDR